MYADKLYEDFAKPPNRTFNVIGSRLSVPQALMPMFPCALSPLGLTFHGRYSGADSDPKQSDSSGMFARSKDDRLSEDGI